MKKMTTRELTTLTMLVAMALIVNLIEPPFPIGIPGVKFGLANIMGIIAFYLYGARELLIVNGMRVLIASLLRGTFLATGFWLALVGTIFASCAIVIFSKLTPMTEVGISSVSATFHNIGQIIVMSYIVNTSLMITYLPIMLFMGVPTGIISGFIVQKVLKGFKLNRSF